MAHFPSEIIYSKQTRTRGRGIFARCPIKDGTLIEELPVLLLPVEEIWQPEGNSELANYVFHWNNTHVGLALGFGSLYNHSYEPNARCEDVRPRTKRIIAIRDIATDEEITINYGGSPESKAPVGFDMR